MMIEKIMVVAPTTAVPISTGLAVALNVLPGAVVFFQQILGAIEIHVEVEVFLDLRFDVRDLLDQREFINRLRVVGDRTVGIDRDRHRPHAEEAEGHQAESEDRRRQHARRHRQSHRADVVGDGHQDHHGQAEVVAGEVARHKARQNSERRSTFLRRLHHFPHVTRVHRGENFHQFRNDRARQRAAGNDRRQLPPLRRVAAQGRDDEMTK